MAERRRRLRPVLEVVLAVLAGLVIGVGLDVVRVGGPRLWLARHGLPPPYLPTGQRVDIGGRSLYLDCRGSGSPTVVLESGMGSGAGAWSAVLDDLAQTTRTCAYDRANLGSSDPRGGHTLADSAVDLAALLQAAGERPPYVVVGHSLGGDYARVFASTFRDRVVGLALIEPFSPDLQVRWIHPLLGSLRPEYDGTVQGLRDLVSQVESLDWAASEAGLPATSVDGLPIEVLVAPRYEPRLDQPTNAAIAQAWRNAYDSLSPGRVDYEIAWGAGHIVQVDRPDLVVQAVRRLVSRVRAAD
jgi:pimeloyl-ACP methyl ester carboxylesterase